MKPDTLDKVLTLIARADEGELEQIFLQARLRSQAMHAEKATNALRTLKVGDEVRLVNLRPRYLNAQRGHIVARKGTRFVVDLNNPIVGRSRRWYRGLTVPATCLQKV